MINCVDSVQLILTRQFNKRNLIFDRVKSAAARIAPSPFNRSGKMEKRPWKWCKVDGLFGSKSISPWGTLNANRKIARVGLQVRRWLHPLISVVDMDGLWDEVYVYMFEKWEQGNPNQKQKHRQNRKNKHTRSGGWC